MEQVAFQSATTTPTEELFNDDESITFDIDSEEFTTDHFRMYDFKVKLCSKVKPHDWTACPFRHQGERAARRDPLVFKYSGSACAEFRRNGSCSRGDHCPYAHGVFECWLHPSKYKTQMCSDTKNCKRPVCFFAHQPSEIRTIEVQAGAGVVSKGDGFPNKPAPIRMDLPSLKQPKVPSMVEMAARMEDLQKQIRQSATPPSSPMAQNPLTMFIHSVIQLQQSMPGINIMQLLHAIIGNQPPSSPLPMPQADLLAALVQSQSSFPSQNQQSQVQAQAIELMRQMRNMHGYMQHSHGPLKTQSDPSVLRAVSMSSENTPLGEHSGPFSNHLVSAASMGNASSLSGLSMCYDTAHMMQPPSCNGQYGGRGSHEGAFGWSSGGDNARFYEQKAPSSRGSEHSARSCEVKSAINTFDMWSVGDIWSSSNNEDSYNAKERETMADKPSGHLLRHMRNHFGSKDSLLDALPRDLSDLKLNDVTNNLAK